MPTIETIIGLGAAGCTTFSYIPQLKKCYQTKRAGDLSFKMFFVLAIGIALWCLYGVLRGDAVIMIANGLSLTFLFFILYYKCREKFGWFGGAPEGAAEPSKA